MVAERGRAGAQMRRPSEQHGAWRASSVGILRIVLPVALLLAGLLLSPSPAGAYHGPGHEVVTGTAHTLAQEELRIGLWRADYGVLDSLDLGTYTLPWLLPVPNAQLKWRPLKDDMFAVALLTGLYYFDADFNFWFDTDSDARLTIVPLELMGTFQASEAWRLSAAFSYTIVRISGTYDPDEFAGAVAVDNLQALAHVEWILGRVVALYMQWRVLLYEGARGDVVFASQLDEFTSVEIHGAASLEGESVRRASNLVLGAHFSWDSFNLRVGLGYGNYNLPFVNIMVATRSPVFELDAFWRF